MPKVTFEGTPSQLKRLVSLAQKIGAKQVVASQPPIVPPNATETLKKYFGGRSPSDLIPHEGDVENL